MSLHVNLSTRPDSTTCGVTASFAKHCSDPAAGTEEMPPFVVSLVHEIRNPLTTINLAAEMLKSLVTDDFQKKYLDIILRGSGKINSIVSDLLRSSLQPGSGQQPYAVGELLDEILGESADRIVLRNVIVCRQYHPLNYTLHGNRPQMKIALSNIIINAIESVNPGSGSLTLVTRTRGDRFIIEIGDNGCGITKANLKNIFRPYFTTKHNGLGIGLSATAKILQDENVEIKVESLKGAGTRFFLLFNKTT